MTSTPTPAATPRAWPTRLAVLALMLVFTTLGLLRLDRIGPYYDEWIYVPVALQAAGDCDIEAAVSASVGCLPTMQAPPYLGVVKAWLSAPLFATFGVNHATVRLPPLVLAAATLVLLFAWARRQFGPGLALVLLAWLVVDASMMQQARFDWGPVVVSNLMKCLLLVGLTRWLEEGTRRWLAIAVVAACLGYWDKLVFVWSIAAIGAATLVTHGPAWITRIRANRGPDWALAGIGVAVVAYFTMAWVLPAMRIDLTGFEQPESVGARLQRVIALYNTTFSALALDNTVFNDYSRGNAWPSVLLFAQLLATPVLVAWCWRREGLRPLVRTVALLALVVLFLLAQMLATRQVGGAHHLIMFWPFNWLHLFALVALAAHALAPRQGRRVALAAMMLALLPWTWVQAQWHLAHQRALERTDRMHPWFSPALGDAARRIAGTPADRVISVHWGTHQAMVSLAVPGTRARYRDWNAQFAVTPDIDTARTDWLYREFLVGRDVLFVGWAPETGLATTPGLTPFLGHWPGCTPETEVLPDRVGRPYLLLTRIRFTPDACLPAPPAGDGPAG